MKDRIGIKEITLTAVMTAALCVLAPLSIPIGPVPISLATFVIYLTVYILGTSKALVAVFAYLMIGLMGVPVFSGYSAGPAKLLGPTGGYLIGYLPMAAVMGVVLGQFGTKIIPAVLGMVGATALLYAMGTAWLMHMTGMDLRAALMAGAVPFIPLDLVKIGVAAVTGPILSAALKKAGLITNERTA